jgi:hypothetical protein
MCYRFGFTFDDSFMSGIIVNRLLDKVIPLVITLIN